MLERLTAAGAALAETAARRRRAQLAEALGEEAPAGVRVDVEDEAIVLTGRALSRRFALDPALRWLIAGRRR